ncbi:MAG TPA: flagellin [Beijerinckiaceae bacterium]|jgi:flagellin
MNSFLTNASAMLVLQSLNGTQRELESTQGRISTGMRVNTASDNAAYWSIATTMKSDKQALSAVQDALGFGAATIDVANSALESTIKVIDSIKSKLVAAREPGIDRTKIQGEIDQLQQQLRSIAGSAVFSSENWLAQNSASPGYNTTKTVVASFSRTDGQIVLGTIDIDTASVKLYDSNDQSGVIDRTRTSGATTASLNTLTISALTDSSADLQVLEAYIRIADDTLSDVTLAASQLGSAKQRLSLQQDFVTTLLDAITRGIGQLVDTDMTRESTRLQALQAQQQLAVQALGIANSNSQIILKLFGG